MDESQLIALYDLDQRKNVEYPGMQRELTAHVVRRKPGLRQVRYLTVDASEMSRPILEKFGFTVIAYSYPCKWKVNP